MMKRLTILIFLLVSSLVVSNAQDNRYSFSFIEVPFKQVLNEISNTTGYRIIYIKEIMPNRNITRTWTSVQIETILDDLFSDEILSYTIVGDAITIYSLRSLSNPFQVFGRLSDDQDGEHLTGANVYTNASQGVTTDNYGLYSIEINPLRDSLLFFSYLGYKSIVKEVRKLNQGRHDMQLSNDENILTTVTITNKEQKQLPAMPIEDVLQGQTYTSAKAISGEQDVIEYLNAIPGIVKMSEGRSGFSVNGSATDQNLILIDDAPIFNPGHALGFLSVFNHEALNSATFHKSAISAKYGGRLSSVLDVRMREGNDKKYSSTISTNPFYSGLTLEGPIMREKASFLVSGRLAHMNYVLNGFEPIRDFYIPKRINFYDIHGKLNFKLGENNRIYISTFLNNDEIIPHKGVDSSNVLLYDTKWQNRTLTVRWNSIWSDKLFTNASVVYSDYQYLKTAEAEFLGYEYNEKSRIANAHLKLEANYYLSKHQTFSIGVNGTSYLFSPAEGSIFVPAERFALQYKIPDIKSRELALFIEDEIKIGRFANINLGIRYSKFYDVGSNSNEYYYDDDDNIIDSVFRKDNDVIRTFDRLEPRIATAFQLHKNLMWQSSWSRTSQYIVRLLNENPTSPNEYWIPAGLHIKPSSSTILSSTLHWDANDFVKLSLGVFKRNSSNVSTFRSGANIFFSSSLIDRQIVQGAFESSGWELALSKAKGSFRYLLSYTNTNATVRFEEINNGIPYTAPHQYQHDFNAQGGISLSKKISVGANWQYRSGDRITLPTGFGSIGGFPFKIYSERNNFKLRDYSRLDISSTFSIFNNSRLNLELNVGVYNLTGQINPFQVEVVRDQFSPRLEFLALSRATPFLHLKLRYL